MIGAVMAKDAKNPSQHHALEEANRGGRSREPVSIDLSAAQVDHVVRAASDGGSVSLLLSGLGELRAALSAGRERLEDPRLSRSLLSGLVLLASFPADGSYVRVTQTARMLGMRPSTTHRYLATLLAAGLLERDPNTRQYRLAP
jgi:hypothetical protein